jgi:hypothetical protein
MDESNGLTHAMKILLKIVAIMNVSSGTRTFERGSNRDEE